MSGKRAELFSFSIAQQAFDQMRKIDGQQQQVSHPDYALPPIVMRLKEMLNI